MTTATRIALRRIRSRFGIGAAVAALLVVFVGVAAFAFWTTSGGGNGNAAAATLDAPTGVSAVPSGPTATVSFTGVTPAYGILTGYYVTRYLGATPSNACGTNPAVTATYLAAAATSCVDSGLASGTYTYRVTAVFRTWTAQSAASASIVVNADGTPPTQVVSLASGAGTAYLGGSTVYYRGDLAGTFTLADAVTDSGTGPASADFPALASNGWTHTAANPTTGTGSAPTITYFGGTYGWGVGATSPGTHTVTGRDVEGNTVTTNLSFASDIAGPTGGALVVAGVAGTPGGAIAYSNTGTFTGTRTDYAADGGSGTQSSVLRREAGTLSGGLCSAFGAATVVTGNPSETTLATGCYRYTLTGTDNVGNTSVLRTIVQVDTVAPTHSISETGANSYWSNGSATLYYRSNVAGSLTISDDVTDMASGPYRAVFPAVLSGGWTHSADTVTVGTTLGFSTLYTSSTYSWLSGATSPTLAERTVTARDMAGNDSTTVLTFVGDAVAPVSGALTLNATAANAGVSTSNSGSGTFTGTRTDWTDLGSGIASSVLTREVGTLAAGTCSAYAAPTTVAGVPNESGLATGCYRYTLTGTDNVGNTASVSTVVRVDRGNPTQVLSENGANSFLTGTTLYYRGGTAGSLTLTSAVSDGALGPKQAVFPAFATAGWGHTSSETVTGASPYTSSAVTWTGAAGTPPSYTVTGYDLADNTVATALTFVNDPTAPSGGALTVNGEAATGGGSTSTSSTGNLSGSYTAYTDSGSGLAAVNGNTFTRATATLVNGVCGTYGAEVAATFPETNLATGCYRYTASALDNVGNTVSVSTVVEVDRTAPTQVLSEIGANTWLVGSTLYYNNNVGGSFTLGDTVTDGATGPDTVTFPAVTATGWTHAAETVTPTGGTLPNKNFTSGTFTWTAGAAAPGSYAVAATDVAGNSATTNLTITPDVTGPTGGALTVTGTTATVGGAYLQTTTGATWPITRTDFNADAGSGFVSSVLTRTFAPGTACTAWQAPITITGTTDSAHTASGCYRYTLTGTDNVGNTTSVHVTMVTFTDATDPTQSLTAVGNGYINGTTLYYRSGSAGSFVIVATVTDNQSGPGQVQFGQSNGTGTFVHDQETVSGGVGTPPTLVFTSSPYSWAAANPVVPNANARSIRSYDNAGNDTGLVQLTFTGDNSVPTGGALNVNGTPASAGAGSSSSTVTGSYAITRTDYSADGGSGLASSVLTREFAAQNAGTCTGVTYGAATTLAGAPSETALPEGCYRYTLTGTDRVGNATSLVTVVRVVPGSLTQSLALTEVSGQSYLLGDTVYYNPATAGSFSLASTLTGLGSDPNQVAFPAMATTNWTKTANTDTTGTGTPPTQTFNSNNFSWTANPVNPAGYVVTGRNAFGNLVSSTITFNADNQAPTTTLAVDGFAGTTAGVTNYSSDGDGSFPVTVTATDAKSGVGVTTLTKATGTLTNGVCGAFGAATVFAGTSETNLATGCYRYSLTATDNVGNTSTALLSTVMVDRTAPTVTITGETGANSHLVGGTLYYNSAAAGSVQLTATVNDTNSAPQSATFPDIASAGWSHAEETVAPGTGTAPSRTFLSSAYSWAAGAAAPTDATARIVTGRDMFGNEGSAAPLTFVTDTTAPTATAALTVNGTAASAAGTTSNVNSATPTITVNSRTDYTADTGGSGLASSVLTYQTASWNGTACGTFGAATTVTGTTGVNPATGATCYRYTLTGTDNVGNSTSISTTVRVNLQVRSVVLANGTTGTAGTLNRTDTITVQYTGPIAVASMCSTWSGDTTNQTVAGNSVVGVTIQEGAGAANDYITVSTSAAACGGDFSFGTLTLGDDDYLASTTIQTFRGTGTNASTIAYNAATYTLTITLGRNETTPGDDGSNNVANTTVATYAPDAGLTGAGGLTITGTGATANVRQF